MGWFNKKEKKAAHLISKTVEYKGYTILLWADDYADKYNGTGSIYFKTGWSVSDYGIYTTGTSADNLEKQMFSHLESAKQYIDKVIAQPQQIEKAFKALDNVC